MDSYNGYKYIHFCMAPSGLYVGWTVYENGYYFGSGRTIDACTLNVKQTVYFKKKVSTRGYTIAPKPSTRDEVPVEKMHPIFKTRAWFGHSLKDKMTKEQIDFVKSRPQDKTPVVDTPVTEPEITYDYFTYKVVDGNLEVYGCRKVNSFKLGEEMIPQVTNTPKTIEVEDSIKGTLHLPMGD